MDISRGKKLHGTVWRQQSYRYGFHVDETYLFHVFFFFFFFLLEETKSTTTIEVIKFNKAFIVIKQRRKKGVDG